MGGKREYENCEVCGEVVENPVKCDGCGRILCVDCGEKCEPDDPAAAGLVETVTLLCGAAEVGGLMCAQDMGGIILDFITQIDNCLPECEDPDCDGCGQPFDEVCASILLELRDIADRALSMHANGRSVDEDS